MKPNIGFTGIHGWIGGFVSEHFINNDYNVIDLGPWCRRLESIDELKNQPSIDWAFHFGANTSVEESFDKPFLFYQDNLIF